MSEYHYAVPTTLEPQPIPAQQKPGGFTSGDRFVIKANIDKGRQSTPGTFRMAGMFIPQKLNGSTWEKLAPTDCARLNPYAGTSGCLYSVQVNLNGVVYESVLEYGRLTALLNQARYTGYTMATSSDSVLELMNYPTDSFQSIEDPKSKSLNGMLFPQDANQSEMPFSIDLDLCINKAAIPNSKCQQIEFSFKLQDANKIGLVSPTATQFRYFLKNVEIRYMTEPEMPSKGPIVMPIHNHSFLGSIINKVNSLTHSPSTNFHTMFMSFLKNSHINPGLNDFTKDYLASEALSEKAQMVEVKLAGSSDTIKYPLRYQTSEILYQFLLAAKEGMWKPTHDVSYAALAQTTKTGYGIGSILSELNRANTPISFNIQLASVPSETYSAFVFTVGEIEL